MKAGPLALLLSFVAAFADTTSFLGLHGLFTAHVTGNFVTLGASLVFGTEGALTKLLALPEFILIVALTRLAADELQQRRLPGVRTLLLAETLLLIAFFACAVGLGTFTGADTPAALLTGFVAVTGMAIQNALHRIYLPQLPPSTIMTNNTTQATLDGADLLFARNPAKRAETRARFERILRTVAAFAAGCALAALLYALIGFWGLPLPAIATGAAALLYTEN